MHFILVICILAAAVAGVNTIPAFHRVNHKSPAHRDVTAVLKGLSQFKLKLQQQGLINSVHIEPTTGDFDEVEALQLVPIIIDQLQKDLIDDEDVHNLKSLFGSMWTLIEEEAQRRNDQLTFDPINPVLKSILHAQEFSHHVKNPHQLPSTPSRGLGAKLAKRTKRNGIVDPEQRILKMAALLIHEQMARSQTRSPRRSSRRHSAAKKHAARPRFEFRRPQAMLVRRRRSTVDLFNIQNLL